MSNALDHFTWGPVPPSPEVSAVISISVQAHDAAGNTVTNFNGAVKASQRSPQPATVLMTEIETMPNRRVELSNMSTNAINISGWRLVLYDRTSWPSPKMTFVIPAGTICPPQGVFTVRSGTGVSVYPDFYTGLVLTWNGDPGNNQIAAALLNDKGEIVDFFCAVDGYPPLIAIPKAVGNESWNGRPATAISFAPYNYQRTGRSDNNSLIDWIQATSSFGVWNTGIKSPFLPAVSTATVTPSTLNFTNGNWSGSLQLTKAGNPVQLHAEDSSGVFGDSDAMNVRELTPLGIQVPPSSFKATAGYVGLGQVFLTEPLSTNLPISLASSSANHIMVPPSIVLLAGTTNTVFAVTNLDDGLVEGPQTVTISAAALGFASAKASITNYDRPPVTLSVSLPSTISESVGWSATGVIRCSAAVAVDVPVRLVCTNNNKVVVQDFIIIPAGQTTANFGLLVILNPDLDGNSIATVSASVPGWVSGQGQTTITDINNANLTLSLPTTVIEGAGVLTNCSVQRAILIDSDVTITLASDSPSRIQVPANVLIPAGQTTAQFNIAVLDDGIAGSNTLVKVTASASVFSNATRNVTITDNDAFRFRFGTLPAAQVAAQPFLVTLNALNANGNVIPGYSGSVSVDAHGFLGDAAVSPITIGPFTNGVWSGFLTVPTVNRGLVLSVQDTLGHSGSSPAFDVVSSQILSLPVADLAYDSLRDKLLVGIRTNATANSQCILPIGPATGTVGTPIPIGADPSRLALADDYSYLYASLEVNSTGGVVRVDLNAQTVDLRFKVGTQNIYGQVVNFVEDMRVQPGHPHTLVATTMIDGGYNQYIAVYDDGVQRPNVVTPVYYVRAYHLTFTESPFFFYVTKPNGLWRNLIATNGVSFINEIAGPQYGPDMVYAAGRLYSTTGDVFNTNNFQTIGTYPANGMVIPDPANARVYFLSQSGGLTTFEVFELATFRSMARLQLPGVTGQAASFVRCGTNRFAFRTSESQLHIFDTSVLYTNSTANLRVSMQASPTEPLMGSNLVYSITVSNAGPSTSFGTSLTNQIPPWSTFVSATASQGSSSQANGVVTASLGELTNGGVAMVTVTVKPNAGGAHLATARVDGLTFDPDQTDNVTSDVRSVLAISTNSAVTPVSLPSNDIVYDLATQRIWASVPAATDGLSNCLVSIDPTVARVESVVPVGRQPAQLTVAPGGQHLYLGLEGESKVQRFDTISQLLAPPFFIGANIGARQLEIHPLSPQTVAVVSFNQLSGMGSGVALYDNGTKRPLDVEANWVQFSTNGSQLFTSDGADGSFSVNNVVAGGLNRTNSIVLDYHYPAEMAVAGNIAYYGSGYIVDFAANITKEQFSSIGWAAIPCLDAPANRLFILFNDSQNWVLQQFNLTTHALEASLTLPPLLADPHDLIRWGDNGLAFRNEANQLFLVQIPLLPPVPQVSLSQTAFPPITTIGSNLTYTILVTNRSSADAHNVIVTDTLPEGAQFVTAQTAQGSVTQTQSTVTFNLGTLAASNGTTLTVVCAPTVAGDTRNEVVVTADWLDTSSEQNMSTIGSWVTFGPELQLTNTIIFPGGLEMAYNPSNQTILLSVGPDGGIYSNSIVALDAHDAKVYQHIPLADKPGKLAVSDDGQFVYTALGTTGGVARVNLASNRFDMSFGLGVNDGLNVWGAGDLKAVPGQPRSIAISRLFGQSNQGVSIYDDDVRRPNSSPGREFAGVYFINFGANASTLYSALPFYFRRIQVSPTGATQVDESTGLVPAYDAEFEFDGGRIYFTTGRVIDPLAKTIVANYPASGRVAPDAVNNRVYYVTSTGFIPSNTQLTFRGFSLNSSNELWSTSFPIASGSAIRLSKLGTNGLAVLTDAGRVLLVPLSKFATPTADLSLEQSATGGPVNPGTSMTTTFTVRNVGPWTATGAIFSNTLPAGVTFVSATSSKGTCLFTNGSVQCFLDSLANGDSATVAVTLTAAAAGVVTNVAWVTSNVADPNLGNNSVAQNLVILPSAGLTIRNATVVQNPATKTTINLTLTLSTNSTAPVSVAYQTADGTALVGQDYDAASGVVTFTPGTTNRTLSLNIIRTNASAQTANFFLLNLQSATNATLLRTQAIGTIVTRAFRTLSISGTNVFEGNTGLTNAVFRVSLSPTSSAPVSVVYETLDGTAASGLDYLPRFGTLNFPPGTATLTLSVPVVGNALWQPTRSFSVLLFEPQGAVFGVNEATGNIVNDDPLPALAITVPPTNQIALQGASAFFAIGAVGTPQPLLYQWRFNQATISGATNNSLALANLQPAAAGVYSVSVQNGNGDVTNLSASLRVIAALGYMPTSNQLILNWTGPYVLQSATNVTGPYLDVPSATSPYTNWMHLEPRRFFRLRALLEGSLGLSVGTNGTMTIRGAGLGGYNYVLQTSTNLITWTPLQTGAAPFDYITPISDPSPARFFRTVFSP